MTADMSLDETIRRLEEALLRPEVRSGRYKVTVSQFVRFEINDEKRHIKQIEKQLERLGIVQDVQQEGE